MCVLFAVGESSKHTVFHQLNETRDRYWFKDEVRYRCRDAPSSFVFRLRRVACDGTQAAMRVHDGFVGIGVGMLSTRNDRKLATRYSGHGGYEIQYSGTGKPTDVNEM